MQKPPALWSRAEERYFSGTSNFHKENIDYKEVEKYKTKPEEAVDFVNQTGIDTIAVQIGNLHGKYPVPKILDLELLQRIRDAIECNIRYTAAAILPDIILSRLLKLGSPKSTLTLICAMSIERP